MDDDVTTTTTTTTLEESATNSSQMTSESESIENSIEFTVTRLNSNDENVIIETIIQVIFSLFKS